MSSLIDRLNEHLLQVQVDIADSKLREQLHNEKNARLRAEAMEDYKLQQKADTERSQLQTKAVRNQLEPFLNTRGKEQAS